MKTIIKISILALLLCIGFIPNSTGASFEPAKTALYLGDDNPGNYSLLQYAVDHSANLHRNSNPQTGYLNAGAISTEQAQSHYFTSLVLHRLMVEGQTYHVPFRLISLFFTQPTNAEKR
jgi:hypothetical protein